MKFGIFIRSVGERTENLCLQSCLSSNIDREHIHIIKNFIPATKAYERMFHLANQFRYDYYLGIDADIILKNDWYEILSQTISKIHNDDYFVFSFYIIDKFLGRIDRGNHFYFGKYTHKALEVLNANTCNTLKPESYLVNFINAKTDVFDEVIGYHGYEQYYQDIFYRFWLQYKRNHSDQIRIQLFVDKYANDNDYKVARAGWNKSKREIVDNILCNRLKIKKISPNHDQKKYFEKYWKKIVSNEKPPNTKSYFVFLEERQLFYE